MSGRAGVCALHRGEHRPVPLTLVVHHVLPRGMGGPDIGSNKVTVCDTGHRNVHTILAWMVFGEAQGQPAPGGSRTEIALARRGYDAWVAAGKPGNPHAAYALHGPGAGPVTDPVAVEH